MDPLITRSLPGAPWSRLPSTWVEWDIRLSEWLEITGTARQHPAIMGVEFFTENPWGIASVFGVFICGFYFWVKPARFTFLKTLGFWILILGLSDVTASALKVFMGRLKPHVTFYNPSVLPALAFPSNHAMNTSVFCFLFYYFLTRIFDPQITIARRRAVAGTLLGYFLFVAWSRVALGQHHVLDVLAGGVLGAIFFGVLQKLFLNSLVKAPFFR